MAETDVLVIGGGPGGLSAALAAAREGVNTMLVERHGCFGGVITQAMIGTIAWYRTKMETVDSVPYGIILPQKVENLLVAGRCVAGDKVSHAATRQMMCCTVTGQGAGVAAAVSVKENVTCRQVDISEVQEALKRQGVRIE